MKICTRCRIKKSLSEFHRDRSRKDGLRSQCKSCHNKASSSWYVNNKDKAHLKESRRTKDSLERKRVCVQLWRLNNLEKVRASVRRWQKDNSGKSNALKSKYKANKLNQTPAWANLDIIKQVYINCPKGKVVDHIIPLQGKTVSGFHVEYNLQYLTPEENCKKGNRI